MEEVLEWRYWSIEVRYWSGGIGVKDVLEWRYWSIEVRYWNGGIGMEVLSRCIHQGVKATLPGGQDYSTFFCPNT